MDFKDLTHKTPHELYNLILDLRRELFNFRFRVSARDLKDTSRIRVCRRNISRIKTLLTKKHASTER